jgi:hypothetical protein
MKVDKERVKWLHAPGHARSMGPAVIERGVASHSLVIDWSEMYFNIDDLRAHGDGYNHFVGKPKTKDKRGRVVNHDVVISTRDDAKVIYDEEFFVDKASNINFKIHPERWGKARVIEWRGLRILVMAWHPQPKARARLQILDGYKQSVRRVEAVYHKLVNSFEPDLVLLGGDLQLPKGNKWYYPNRLALRLKLRYANHHIDWQMWSKDWITDREHELNMRKINAGIDHPWMVRYLTRLKKEK